MKKLIQFRSIVLAVVILGAMGAFAGWMAISSPSENSPYIDAIKKRWKQEQGEDVGNQSVEDSAPANSYTEKQKLILQQSDKLGEKEALDRGEPSRSFDSKGYSERLKLDLGPSEKTEGDYAKKEKAKLKAENPSETSAIQKVKDGKSELEMKRVGKITGTGGFRFGVNSTRTVDADQANRYRKFEDIYPPDKTPDVQFFYEYQPLRSNIWGSLGLYTSFGVAYRTGQGLFERAPYDPSQQVMGAAENAAGRYNEQTNFKFTFLTMPLSVGVGYRFLAARWIVPYAVLAPTAIIFAERRSNPRISDWGRSNGITQIVGTAFAMDWLDHASSWSMYEAMGVKRIYFNLEYYRLSDIGNNEIQFETSAIFAGFSFDI